MGRHRLPLEVARLAAERRRQREAEEKRKPAEMIFQVHAISIPSWVLADRDRRLFAPRTLSMIFFGDPVLPRWRSPFQNFVFYPERTFQRAA